MKVWVTLSLLCNLMLLACLASVGTEGKTTLATCFLVSALGIFSLSWVGLPMSLLMRFLRNFEFVDIIAPLDLNYRFASLPHSIECHHTTQDIRQPQPQTYEFFIIILTQPTMDSLLIYDIQSQVASQNGEDSPPFPLALKKEEKETEISDVPNPRIIKVQPSHPSNPPEVKEEIREHDNIIFYEDQLGKSTSSMDINETNRCFLKQQEEDEDQDASELYDQVQELQELEEVAEQQAQPDKQSKLHPQGKAGDQSVIVLANVQQFVRQLMLPTYRITCLVDIQRNVLGMPKCYRLFLQQSYQFLLAAKKEMLKYYSSFIISKHPNHINKRSGNYVGKLEGNFVGTEYRMFACRNQMQGLRMVIEYQKNIIGFNGPRTFTATKLNPQVKANLKTNLTAALERNEKSRLLQLATSKPVLKKGKYRLDFGGKVKLPSAKNFILQHSLRNHPQKCLLFGKLQQDRYILQIQYPLTIFQAFAICLTSLDSKLLVN